TLTKKLDAKYDIYKEKGGYLNTRQKEILKFIEENQPVKISDIFNALDNITIHTLKKDLLYMKTEQMISSVGKGKGTVYLVEK
ncbi:MAG: DeoR/GlpR family transcriptional regulator of sugar metabolism, partial [Planctomycetota bacterium]